jgi:hypothetical protein
MTATPPVRYTLGLDLGKVNDSTALAIAEERPLANAAGRGWAADPDFALPWLQRWPLHTPYHTIAEEVAARVLALGLRPNAEVALFADATGVGVAVMEILERQRAIRSLRHRYAPVTIVAGLQTTSGWERWHPWHHVPKRELVGVAQAALQRRKLRVAAGLPEAATLTEELRNFEVRITASANAVYSHRDGEHDDLLLAAALALWGARQRTPSRALFASDGIGGIPRRVG